MTKPKLRFYEFKHTEWEIKKGNEIFQSISNKKHNSNLYVLAITQNHGAIPRKLINYQVIVQAKISHSLSLVDQKRQLLDKQTQVIKKNQKAPTKKHV